MLCCDEFIVRGVFWLVGIAPPVVVIYPLPAQRQSSDLMGVVVPRVWGSGTVLTWCATWTAQLVVYIFIGRVADM